MKQTINILSACLLLALLGGCQEEVVVVPTDSQEQQLIRFQAQIDQVYHTRVNDSGFANGDRMGVYVVDYDAQGKPGTLQSAGNRADNVGVTYVAESNTWKTDPPIYWKDKKTPIDAYGYYPFDESLSDVTAYPFAVQTRQDESDDNGMSLYEKSDFLWAKTTAVNYGEMINLTYRHLMAGMQVTLVEGDGFEPEEWNTLSKQVQIVNTIPQAAIHVERGEVTPLSGVASSAITPAVSGKDYRAVLIPQTVAAGTVLLTITVDEDSYHFARQEATRLLSGKIHKFTILVDKLPQGDYQFKLMQEAVTTWENDQVSHQAETRSYVVVHVEKAGTLKQCIEVTGRDYTTIRNLKIVGHLSVSDFNFMRDEMDCLEAVNLYEATVPANKIWSKAFSDKKSLHHIVFPQNLKEIAEEAFMNTHLMGDLVIPEGVTKIDNRAFYGISTLTGALSLPSSLLSIGENAFGYCSFSSELLLPENLQEIRNSAFQHCSEFVGQLRIPENVELIGAYAFEYMTKIRGDVNIPEKVTAIQTSTFSNSGFDGHIYLHDKITSIAKNAFSNTSLSGELILPDNLVQLNAIGCRGITHIVFPDGLKSFSSAALTGYSLLQDTITLPPLIETVPQSTFASCSKIRVLRLPKMLQSIASNAFSRCVSLELIISEAETPPTISSNSFNGVDKSTCVVEVPINAVDAYRNAPYWKEFKRITSYRNFVCRPMQVNALNRGNTRELILNADGDWTVEKLPDWCQLSQMSGSKKTALTLTVDPLVRGDGDRQDSIVFRLDDEHTTYCLVSQYDYQHEEDETIALQTATQGKGINLFWVGDGYDAKDIAEGKYLNDMKQQMEYFFAIEPYKTYRDYFNVHTAIARSEESGIGTLNTWRDVKFESALPKTKGVRMVVDANKVLSYVLDNTQVINKKNLSQSLVVCALNSPYYEGVTTMYYDGSAVAFCPMSEEAYPYDARGIVQHEAGGHGFGKLLDEYIYHEAFIQTCNCADKCRHVPEFLEEKSRGWGRNLSLEGQYSKNEWRHLIFDDRYSDIVDIYEGGYFHSRGVYRSEKNSCMNNNIPYYSTISRQAIVERIMDYAGEIFDFEMFVARDSRELGDIYVGTRSDTKHPRRGHHHAPIIVTENPFLK